MNEVSPSEIRVSSSALTKHLLKKLKYLIFASVALILTLWIVVSATVVRFVFTENGAILVHEDYSVGGVIPNSSTLLVTTDKEPLNKSILGNMIYSVTPQKNTCSVTVLAGNEGRLTMLKDKILFGKEIVFEGDYSAPLIPSGHILDHSYLVKPINCPNSDLYEITDSHIYGVQKKASDQ